MRDLYVQCARVSKGTFGLEKDTSLFYLNTWLKTSVVQEIHILKSDK